MILVDTSAWYASIIPSDENHAVAAAWLDTNTAPLLTTDYIVDETLTLLRARGEGTRALLMGDRFFNSSLTEIYLLTEEDIKQTWEVFRQFKDKEWSFTDCASKVVIEKLGLAQAFAFDRHFHQFGTVQVVP